MSHQIYQYDAKDPQKRIPTVPVDGVNPATAKALYRNMLRLRRIEEALIAEYHPADEMRCPVHFCLGQEAVPASLSLLAQKDDYVFSHHRSHGYFFGKNAPMRDLFAEIYGKETGASGGRAGSQDISHSDSRFYSGAILAGSVPIAAGAAVAIQNAKKNLVAVSGFGEGATDEGVFWETLNYAATRDLPLVLLCENNLYATYSPQTKRSAERNIAERVATFGIPSRTVFGNDVVAVYRAVNEAFESARSGRGPVFVEAFTYRWNGHVGPENDDGVGYRPADEIRFWKDHCPLKLMGERMRAAKLITAVEEEAFEKEARTEIAEAFAYAKGSKFPTAPKDFAAWNYSATSPVADRLLKEAPPAPFNENQAELIPAPY